MSLGIPFNELGQRISAAELTLYQVYYRNQPWGEERADIRSAMAMSQTANMHRDSKRHPKPFELYDFMPFSEKPVKEESSGEPVGLREAFKSFTKR